MAELDSIPIHSLNKLTIVMKLTVWIDRYSSDEGASFLYEADNEKTMVKMEHCLDLFKEILVAGCT